MSASASSPEEFLASVFEILGRLNESLSLLEEIYLEKFPERMYDRPKLTLVGGDNDA